MKRAIYVLDANSLIAAWDHYPQNHFGDLWGQLEVLIKHGRLRSPDQVLEELDAGDDALKQWAKGHRQLFHSADAPVQRSLQEVGQKLPDFVTGKGRSTNYADPWVVALARHLDATVVTEEKGKGLGPGAIKIPAACRAFGIRHSRFRGLFAAENWTFRLER